MWIVGTHEDRFYSFHDNEEDAIKDYEERKENYSPIGNEIRDIESKVVLAKVQKQVGYVDTGIPVIDVDENGEEFERNDEFHIEFEEKEY